MKKRGFLSIKALIIVIICAIILIAFIQAGKSLGSRDNYYKEAAAKDIALIIDSLYATPGDATIRYGQDLSKHTIWTQNNTIIVYKTNFGKSDITKGIYKFIGPSMDEIIVRDPETLIIEKKNGKIRLYSMQRTASFGSGSTGGGGTGGTYN